MLQYPPLGVKMVGTPDLMTQEAGYAKQSKTAQNEVSILNKTIPWLA